MKMKNESIHCIKIMFPYKGNGKVIHNINKEMNISLNTPLTLLDKKSVFET